MTINLQPIFISSLYSEKASGCHNSCFKAWLEHAEFNLNLATTHL